MGAFVVVLFGFFIAYMLMKMSSQHYKKALFQVARMKELPSEQNEQIALETEGDRLTAQIYAKARKAGINVDDSDM